ncbi:MAG TPA: RNA polymerase sigma factor [Geobacteraceae bacterium]|nr:RNA polymerase sigma factor [Geobacteraceae bacterium]
MLEMEDGGIASRLQNSEALPFSEAAKPSYMEVGLDSAEALNHFLGGVERHSFAIAQISTGNREDSLDIVHDAMLGFVRKYSLRPAEEWKPLFYRVLYSRIRDWQRRSMVRNRFRAWFGIGGEDGEDAGDPLDNVADISSPDPAREVMRKDAGEAIRNSLRELPVRQRQAFLLRAWEGMDVKDTACAMGCSEGSVKTHYSRAVHTLRDLLEEHRI